jgi:hypothetical protein
MMDRIGYRLPFVLMTVLGLFFLAHYYIPHPVVQKPAAIMLQWKQPLGGVILLTAAFSLVWLHLKRVRRRERRYGYSIVMLAATGAMLFVGMAFGVQEGSVFSDWFENLITPLESTMFSLLAFFVASAAFRAFRARTANATVLLVSASIVILGLIPFTEDHLPFVKEVTDFLLEYPNTAAKRAILIGVALGMISVAIKTIFGVDKTILKKERRDG